MNENLAQEKKLLENNNKEKYIYLENMYKFYFEKYLCKKVNILKYDNEIKNSNLDFGISKKKIILNGLKEFLNTKYICLLNNFYIEKLSLEQIKVLEDHTNNKKYELTEEIEEVIRSTYKEVIKKDYSRGKYIEKRFSISYGTEMVPENFAYNDDLVLKIFYSRNERKLEDKDFIKNLRDKKQFLEIISNRIIDEINEKLNITCTVLKEKTNI